MCSLYCSPATLVYAQELVRGTVGMASGMLFGVAFGMVGIASALLGALADHTTIAFVFQICSFLPLIGLAAAFLPRVHERYLHPEQAKS